jgi:predicted RNase H-like nuclease (RuvC/YqgF family)
MSHPEAVARQMTRDTERIKALEAEVERLEGERSGLRYTVKGLIAANRQMADRIENLEAKVERLREALRAIRDQEWTENALDPQWAGRIARAALAGEGDG